MLYTELELHFTAPKDWIPNKEQYFGRHKRLPRKLKKLGKKWDKDPNIGLWYRQYHLNRHYNTFLIKQLTQLN